MNKTILAINTATENCSIALITHNNELYIRNEIALKCHTQKILPMIDEVLKEAKITLNQIHSIAYARGPGSFTSLRIGICIAKGLAFSKNLPMIGISSLQSIAQNIYRRYGLTRVACAIDARMNEIYWGNFYRLKDGSWNSIDIESTIPYKTLEKKLINTKSVFGIAKTKLETCSENLNKILIKFKNTKTIYSEAQDIAYLAKFELEKGNVLSVNEATPVYLRDKIVSN
ncbi:hypothetical protein CF66_2203 [Candidatus Photodesmus katoptron]|uniref:tRNA threonylcarbamoyladenosine biosynthesis protein TsaB n=1 Tax=Candidatus Photodesmus katoptron Akat1 TaxID=1236703 RepID=S3DH30_9GAMM|nr:tRNA (adenosine(37)-N6)-threonylcarbamoyltransferase complex dimerization subunit type 1 TsaB [Candidatus Photodesmus katoptron]EPE37757.1 glycoprotease [Candidatus Photodesmus katoptron Akat1]KEY90521.1 hypothetical protein CF66_2203 [Candidatus Photodesmus katoptron]